MINTLSGKLTSRGNLNGNVNTIVFAHNYNDLTNKPQINNVTLQGNKTASELGLATPSDITVTSVNEQTGDVVLSGSDIDYSVGMSLNAKIDDLESQIVGSGVQSVNGMTGNVTLTSNDINYSTGVTIKNKIDSVEGEIPSVYVSSVNGTSGAVTLTGSNIDYSEGVSLKDKIDAVEGEIPVIDYPVTSVNEKTGAVSITAQDVPMSGTDSTPTATAIGDLFSLTTSDKSSLVGAVNSINEVIDISSAFVPNSGISNYDFFVRAYYNKGMKKVSGSFSCRVTSGTMGSVPMCTIDSDYRPSSNTGFPIIATLSGGVTFYSCTIGSNGQITQNLTSSLTGVFCEFEYYI